MPNCPWGVKNVGRFGTVSPFFFFYCMAGLLCILDRLTTGLVAVPHTKWQFNDYKIKHEVPFEKLHTTSKWLRVCRVNVLWSNNIAGEWSCLKKGIVPCYLFKFFKNEIEFQNIKEKLNVTQTNFWMFCIKRKDVTQLSQRGAVASAIAESKAYAK